jgi:thiol-disulfide isomerase/thioredoxin
MRPPRLARLSIWIRQLAIVAALAGSTACASSGGPPPPSSPSPLLDQPAPDFAKRTLQGDRLDTAQLRGKVVVVEFFAQYCEPCRKTLPAVEKLHARSGGDVQFIGVSIDEYESTAREIAQAYGLTYPVIHDAGGLRGRFRVTDLPATFVIDPQGVTRWVRIGGSGSTESDLEKAIAAAAE